MKRLFTFIFLLSSVLQARAQISIYSQDFNTGSAPEWSLNTADLGGTTSLAGNQWMINDVYAPGPSGTATPHFSTSASYYLHMNCGPALSPLYGLNCNYNAAATGETYFAAMNTPIVTTGYTGVHLKFNWLCYGSAAASGKLYYRTSASGYWFDITGPPMCSTSVAVTTVSSVGFDDKPFLEFAFAYNDLPGIDPAFGVDDIEVYYMGLAGPAVAAFTYTPNDTVCEDSCVKFTSSSTGTIDSIRWTVSPGGATATTTPFTKCFSTPGTYTVVLTASGGGTVDTESAVITVKQSPHPVIIKSGSVLTVSGTGYTSYKWYNGTTAIPGATNDTYTYTSSGVFSVKVDSNGCTGISNVINTLGVGQLNGGDNNYWVAQSDYTSITLRSMEPANEELQVTVADPAGRIVARDTWNAGDNIKQISAANLPPGLYIIRLSSDNQLTILKMVSR